EYCSLHELLDSYSVLFQKQGKTQTAEMIESIFYNAAQGSRNPNHSCIAYLKTDNSFEMMGTKNGEVEPNRKQTRYKYSPAHQDVAVCCNPNAGRITPYFLAKAWLKENENTLVNAWLAPSILATHIQNKPIRIETITEYPFQNSITFKISNPHKIKFQIKIRKPSWAIEIKTKEKYGIENDWIVFDRIFQEVDSIQFAFETNVLVREDLNQEKYFSYGALFYAKSIEAIEQKGKTYASDFNDWMYEPKELIRYAFIKDHQAQFEKGMVKIKAMNKNTNQTEWIELIPFGKTILRQVSF
ncbi:MAG: hypothetical protein ACOVP1_00290, partial [Bacteroidia bacterium]